MWNQSQCNLKTMSFHWNRHQFSTLEHTSWLWHTPLLPTVCGGSFHSLPVAHVRAGYLLDTWCFGRVSFLVGVFPDFFSVQLWLFDRLSCCYGCGVFPTFVCYISGKKKLNVLDTFPTHSCAISHIPTGNLPYDPQPCGHPYFGVASCLQHCPRCGILQS